MDFMSQTQNFLFLFDHDWKKQKMHHHLARVPFIHLKCIDWFFDKFLFYRNINFLVEIWNESLAIVSSMTSFVRSRRTRFTNFLCWSILEAVHDFVLVYAIQILQCIGKIQAKLAKNEINVTILGRQRNYIHIESYRCQVFSRLQTNVIDCPFVECFTMHYS